MWDCLGGTLNAMTIANIPPNNPTIPWSVTLDPGHHSFPKWAIEAIKKITGKGAPRMGAPRMGSDSIKDGGSSPRVGMYQPPPFFGTLDQSGNTVGMGMKKKKQKKTGKGLLLGKNSPFKNIPLLNILL